MNASEMLSENAIDMIMGGKSENEINNFLETLKQLNYTKKHKIISRVC